MKKVTSKQKTQDPRLFVNHWFKINSLSTRMANRKPNLFSTLFLDYLEFVKTVRFKTQDSQIKPLGEKIMSHALSEYLSETIQKELETALDVFKCTTEDLTPIHRFVGALTGNEDSRHVAVLAHWVWCVKRKGMGLETVHNVMPIVYGKQGGGKTMALQRLIGPISDYQLNMKMTQLSDERQYEGFSQNFVCLFDELQGIERTDLNALKNQITTIMNSYRKLHTHQTISVPQRCSFLGATNKPINENFSDSTGMRRFWEIQSLPLTDWEAINSIDYNALWRGVDENRERGYLTGDVLHAVHTEQATLVNKDDLEEFMAEVVIAPDGDEHKTITLQEAYDAYVQWCGRNGIQYKNSKPVFAKKLNNRVPNYSASNGGTKTRHYKVNVNCSISDGAVSNTIITLKR